MNHKSSESYSQLYASFTPYELQIVKELGYDLSACYMIKAIALFNPVNFIPVFDNQGFRIEGNGLGICVELSDDELEKAFNYILENKTAFRGKGYNLFLFEDIGDDNEGYYHIALIRNATDLDLIKWRGTSRDYTGHTNSAILSAFTDWSKKRDFILISLNHDMIGVGFEDGVPPMADIQKEVSSVLSDALYDSDKDKTNRLSNIIWFYWE